MSAPENPKQTKNPITLKIKFKSSSLEQFIERYSVDVSKSGIFIRTKEPLAVGTQLRFEFQLQDGNGLLSGDGTVVWNRAVDPARASVAPGMGVRFDKLTADSQKVLERILNEKARRGDSNTESRFDAGVRALREGNSSEANVTAQSQATPKAEGGFGDEPTRAVPADQVAKLAAETAEDDPPTRQVAPPDLTEEVRRAMGNVNVAESARQLTPISPPTATPATPAAPVGHPGNLGRTLLGQGFMMGPRNPAASVGKDGPSAPGSAQRDAPSVEIRKEPSQKLPASQVPAGSGAADSAKTPTASADEQRARIADSNRTPTGGAQPTPPSQAATPVAPVSRPPDPLPPVSKPVMPTARAPEPAAFPPPAEVAPKLSTPPLVGLESTPPPKKPGSPIGLIVGIIVLLGILGALAYVFLLNGKLDLRGKTPGTTGPGTTGTTDVVKPVTPEPTKVVGVTPAPEVKTEPVKPPEPTSVPVKPAEPTEGVEVTTDPAGVKVEFGGKTFGPTPTRVPGLAVGSQITLSLRGYQEAKIKLRNAPDESKPLFFKLTAIERVIEINSTPKGADVLLDGKRVGKTPFVLKKIDTTKAHQIEVRRAGFAAWTHSVSDTDSFVAKNRKEVLTLNATLAASEDGGKKGGHVGKKETPAGDAAPAGGTAAPPAEAPKAEEKPSAPAPEPEKAAAPAP